jgi:acyl-CoA synthetase (AMP-forming)/AMP-acid ligase II
MGLICGVGGVCTMADVEREAVSTAQELRTRGVQVGDRVMLRAANSAAYVTALLALMHAGASVLLLDYRELPDAAARLMRQAGVKLCLVDDDGALPSSEVPSLSVYELQALAADGIGEAELDVTEWCKLPDSLLMCSSGTTGTPKVIAKSGESILRNLRRNIDQVGHVESDVLTPLLPFSHQYGLSMVLIAWLARCSLVVSPYRRLDHALRMAESCGTTVFDATPSTYRSIVNIVGRRPALRSVLASARMLCVGAAPVGAGLVERCREEFGQPLLDSYGSTEMGNVSFATLDNPVACGRAVEGVRLRVVGDDGRDLAPGGIGEILVRTPDIMTGHLDDSGRVVPVTGDWFATGDVGLLDVDANLHVFGRKSAVHRMGYTLYPEVIESKIAEAGCTTKIVALPDERRGSTLIAFVEDDEHRDQSYWQKRIASLLPAYEIPNRVVLIDGIPLNRNGKPDTKELVELAMSA